MSLMITVEQIKKHEGYKQYPYYCTGGKLTIGYGRNLEDNGIDEEEAEQLSAHDIKEAKAGIKRRIDVSRCNEPRQAVLVNMAFNLGVTGLMGFKKMIANLEQGNYEQAALEMLHSRWANQVPGRANELAKQMLSGEWQ